MKEITISICICDSDLDQTGQAHVDASCFLWYFHVADGDVGHNRQHKRLQRLVKAVRETLGPWHLNRRTFNVVKLTWMQIRAMVHIQLM